MAAGCGAAWALSAFVAYGVDLEAQDLEQNTAVIIAASAGNGMKPGFGLGDDRARHLAHLFGSKQGQPFRDVDHAACIMLLAEAGANLDARDRYGRTAAIMAARGGTLGCLVALANCGADLSALGNSGGSALGQARKRGWRDCAQFIEAHLERDVLRGCVATR